MALNREDSHTKWIVAVVTASMLYLAYKGWANTEDAANRVPGIDYRTGKLEAQVEILMNKVDLLLDVAVRRGEISPRKVEEANQPDATPDRSDKSLQRKMRLLSIPQNGKVEGDDGHGGVQEDHK